MYPPDEAAEDLVLAMIEDGVFSVDDGGRIWRHAQGRYGQHKPLSRRRRAEFPGTNGYLRLRVSVNGIRIRVSAHRIVWRYFATQRLLYEYQKTVLTESRKHLSIPEGYDVDHIDTNRKNNHPDNLQLVTKSENTRLAWERTRSK